MSTDVSVRPAAAAAGADVRVVPLPAVLVPPQATPPLVPAQHAPGDAAAPEEGPGPEPTGSEPTGAGRLARREAVLHQLTLDRRRRRWPGGFPGPARRVR